ncbi:uncharacterized protein LOC131247091 [Magnolia sinica]|uniref:uncharacterized protein LOC131247091 n=1 Tax=Magnolia sinica TaxID=86752 RepID=UPI00265897B6|nr:uncharacterized protein LOC131247091 [Magnolia sinica]
MVFSMIISGLKEGKFLFSIKKNPPSTLSELISRTWRYTDAEEFFSLRKSNQTLESSSKGKRRRDKALQQANKKRSDDNTSRDRRPSQKPKRKDKCKYCRFYRDHGHNTNNCVNLKDEIETIIRKGHLQQYTKEERQAWKDNQLHRADKEVTKIRMIYGGPSGGRDSNRARKAHSKSTDPEHYIHLAKRPKKELRVNPCSLTFMEDDARGIQHPHDDALVVTMTIVNHKVYHILVDTGSSTYIIHSEAFDKIGIDRSYLQPVKTPLHGFDGDKVISEGAISLPVTAGEGRNQVTLLVNFLIVNMSSVHNIILGWPSLNVMRAVVSTYHLMIKFPTEGGVEYIQGDQHQVRRCYLGAVRKGLEK